MKYHVDCAVNRSSFSVEMRLSILRDKRYLSIQMHFFAVIFSINAAHSRNDPSTQSNATAGLNTQLLNLFGTPYHLCVQLMDSDCYTYHFFSLHISLHVWRSLANETKTIARKCPHLIFIYWKENSEKNYTIFSKLTHEKHQSCVATNSFHWITWMNTMLISVKVSHLSNIRILHWTDFKAK